MPTWGVRTHNHFAWIVYILHFLLALANSGFGATFEKYSWTQTLDDVSITIPVEKHIRGKDIDCRITPTHLYMGIRGCEPILDVGYEHPLFHCRDPSSNELRWRTLFGRLRAKMEVVSFVSTSIKTRDRHGGDM